MARLFLHLSHWILWGQVLWHRHTSGEVKSCCLPTIPWVWDETTEAGAAQRQGQEKRDGI